jgi:hypothetical protein
VADIRTAYAKNRLRAAKIGLGKPKMALSESVKPCCVHATLRVGYMELSEKMKLASASTLRRSPKHARAGRIVGRLTYSTKLRTAVRRAGRPALAIGVLTIITLWTFHQQLFEQWTFPWDFLGTYTTTPAFVAATFGHGHPLSWSPFVASGFPTDVDPQAGVYFPGWWILGALRIALTLQVLTTVQVAHVLLGGIGVLLLARVRRLTWMWATVAAVAYLFFGGFYGQAEHADYFRGFAYLPWLLWALTPPEGTDRWTRLIVVPLIAWVIASGAYPGQIVSFAITGFVYLAVALRASGRGVWRRHSRALLLAIVASAAVCFAILWPYIRAEQAGELYRANEPTVAGRSAFSLSSLDIFGLYLNNFAWTFEGTITTLAVGIPVLVGLACAKLQTIRRQAPLLACGLVALILATTPKINLIGRAMVALRPLFPSRFPAADYKATIALALILISVDAWSHISATITVRRSLAIVLAGSLLIAGALLVPSTHAQPTRELWLVIAVTIASSALALYRPPARILACLLIALVVIDGTREIHDYRLAGTRSPWQEPPSGLAYYMKRDGYVHELPERLEQAPASRPARIPEESAPEPNATGWVADAYHEADYDPTLERVLFQAQHNAAFSTLLQAPWHGYLFACATVGCRSGNIHLPPPQTWKPNPNAQTISYSAHGIVYDVNVDEPTLMVENELAIRGWHTNARQVQPVSTGIPFRAWRLSPGHYRFTTTFQEPDRGPQYAALLIALLGWLGCAFVIIRKSSDGLGRLSA